MNKDLLRNIINCNCPYCNKAVSKADITINYKTLRKNFDSLIDIEEHACIGYIEKNKKMQSRCSSCNKPIFFKIYLGKWSPFEFSGIFHECEEFKRNIQIKRRRRI